MSAKPPPRTNGSWWATLPREGYTEVAMRETDRMRESSVSWPTVSSISSLSAEIEHRKKAKASYAGEES